MEALKAKVLIVDDEPYILRVLRYKLESAGYRVETALDGIEALEKLHEVNPTVLITDIHMPGMTGKDLCQKIKNNHEPGPELILVITSATEKENRIWTDEMDRTHFIEKPFSPRGVLRIIDDHCGVERTE
ncbi:MAG: response regulator [bacterium]|nr:response regulator [bacterium]